VEVSTNESLQDNVHLRTDPYPQQELATVLSRTYHIDTLSWPLTHTAGQNLVAFQFPGALFNITNIREKLGFFQYFRSAVNVEIRFPTVDFLYGMLQVSWLNGIHALDLGNGFRTKTMYQRSTNNAMYMDVSSQTGLKFTIPWRYIKQYLNHYNTNEPTIGTVWLDVAVPLTSSSVDPTDHISVMVYASFSKPEVAGPKTFSALPMYPRRYIVDAVCQGKTKKSVKQEAVEKSETGVLTGIAEAVETIGSALTPIPIVGGIAHSASSIAGMVLPILRSFNLSKPTTAAALMPRKPAVLQDLVHGRGLDQSTRISLDPDNILSVDAHIMGVDNPQPSLAEIVRIPFWLQTWTFNALSELGTPFTITCHPDFMKRYTPGSLGEAWYSVSHLYHISRFFEFWRGSLKFHFKFVCSKFTAARFRIFIMYQDAPLDTEVDDGDYFSGVVDVHGCTDYSVSVPYLFSTIYSRIDPANNGNFEAPLIGMSLISDITVPDIGSDSSIYVMVFAAAGEDTQFSHFIGLPSPTAGHFLPIPIDNVTPPAWFDTEPPTGIKGEAQSIAETFSKEFPPLVPGTYFITEHGYASGEIVVTLNECLHRYSALALASDPTTLPLTYYPFVGPMHYPGPGYFNHQFWLCVLFTYWRGAMRYKNILHILENISNPYRESGLYTVVSGIPRNTNEAGVAALERANYGSSGFIGVVPRINNVVEAEIPWYELVPFHYVMPEANLSEDPQRIALPFGTQSIYYAMGEDFCVSCITSPPLYSPHPYVPPPGVSSEQKPSVAQDKMAKVPITRAEQRPKDGARDANNRRQAPRVSKKLVDALLSIDH
jgi:hypothetical protein